MPARSILLTALVLMAVAASSTARPQERDPALSPAYAACMDKSGGVTASMLDCISGETDRQDKALNAAYRKLMATLKPDRQKQLREAQRLWISFREANCGFYADPEGGTAASVAAADCVLQATAARTAELSRLTDQE